MDSIPWVRCASGNVCNKMSFFELNIHPVEIMVDLQYIFCLCGLQNMLQNFPRTSEDPPSLSFFWNKFFAKVLIRRGHQQILSMVRGRGVEDTAGRHFGTRWKSH